MLWNCRRGATVHFSCDEGYELQGSKSISCLRVTDSYVGWSDDRPICRGEDRQRCMCASSPKLVPAWPPVIFSYPSALIAMRSFPTVVGCPAQFIASFPCFVLWNLFSPLHSDWPDIDPLAGVLLLPAVWLRWCLTAHHSGLTNFWLFLWQAGKLLTPPPYPAAPPRHPHTLSRTSILLRFSASVTYIIQTKFDSTFFFFFVGNIIALIDEYLIFIQVEYDINFYSLLVGRIL